ncbi:hypothetical protein AYO40_01605 [Planctomycetaceae bacterium SCGC AG-212-D15]|nr:hypothetical protein AYO40_01605 [Planctomycetaceae bacterium SCGC AG-212-D15]
MNAHIRVTWSMAVVGSILTGVVVWLTNVPDLSLAVMAQEGERSRELDRALVRSRARAEGLAYLVQELAAGHQSLSAAARESRDLHEDDPSIVACLHLVFGGGSDDEALCRHLVMRVSAFLRSSPRHYREVLPRLEAEFKRRYPLAKPPTVQPLEKYAAPPPFDSVPL